MIDGILTMTARLRDALNDTFYMLFSIDDFSELSETALDINYSPDLNSVHLFIKCNG